VVRYNKYIHMTRLIIPLILIAAAIGLFVIYINPTYQSIKDLSTQVASYQDALDKSLELRTVRGALLAKRNTFSDEDVLKLERILPDNVDNIRLIIDINNIAAQHNLSITKVQLGEVSDSSRSRSATAVGSSGDPVGSVQIGFSISASYDDFLAFLHDLEHSLRIVDVQRISFRHSGLSATDSYDFQIRT